MQAPAEKHRLFFALLPDKGMLARILAAAEALRTQRTPRGRWVPSERLHLTLAFLGDFPASNSDLVGRALAAGDSVRARPFELTLDSASSFPGRRPPWVLRCERSRESLLPFVQSLVAALEGGGFRTEAREFVPHVTLLRDADSALDPTDIDPIRWPVQDFALMQSRSAPVREYVVLRRWRLAGQ